MRLVLAVASRALLEACASLGADRADLLARAGLVEADLASPDAHITTFAADALWAACVTCVEVPALALRAARAVPPSAFRVIDYLATTGPTLGAGVSRVAAYFHLIDQRGAIVIEPREGGVALLFESRVGAPLPRQSQEFTLALFFMRMAAAAQQPFCPLDVSFTFERPADEAEHRALFGITPRFGASEVSLVIPRGVFDAPTRQADEGLFALLDEHARLLAERAPPVDSFAARARAAVDLALTEGDLSLASVARRLSTSERSLQRRLDDEGLSFATLVDASRRARAEALLRADVSLVEIAFLLGFSEQSAFTRAFKRWTGQTPREARKALRPAR